MCSVYSISFCHNTRFNVQLVKIVVFYIMYIINFSFHPSSYKPEQIHINVCNRLSIGQLIWVYLLGLRDRGRIESEILGLPIHSDTNPFAKCVLECAGSWVGELGQAFPTAMTMEGE